MTHSNAFGAVTPTTNSMITNGAFVTENNSTSVIGSTERSSFDTSHSVLQPMSSEDQINNVPPIASNNNQSNY